MVRREDAEALKERLEAANPGVSYEVVETTTPRPPFIGQYYVRRTRKR